jgi:uncharacterized protein YndB with AHSA1/START domain
MPSEIGRPDLGQAAACLAERPACTTFNAERRRVEPDMPRKHEHVDELLPSDGRWELRFVRSLEHPPAEVWAALTDPERVVTWFPFRIEGECVAGATVRFVPPEGGAAFEGEMVACDPPSRWEVRWGRDELVRFELEPARWGTLLTLVNVIDEVGKAARDAAGWHVTLDRLAAHLDGEAPPAAAPERWGELFRGYAETFGPEGSSIGLPESHAGAR